MSYQPSSMVSGPVRMFLPCRGRSWQRLGVFVRSSCSGEASRTPTSRRWWGCTRRACGTGDVLGITVELKHCGEGQHPVAGRSGTKPK